MMRLEAISASSSVAVSLFCPMCREGYGSLVLRGEKLYVCPDCAGIFDRIAQNAVADVLRIDA